MQHVTFLTAFKILSNSLNLPYLSCKYENYILTISQNSSHPDSERYGKHFTAEEVQGMFAPEEETIANIMNWLTSFGIHGSRIVQSENKSWIGVDVTVEEAEALLPTEFYEHEHKYSPKVRVGCHKYVTPFAFRNT